MPKRVLAIGVGGSGKAAVTMLKERLEETYGRVPDNVVLLTFDTDDLRPTDTFAGTRLTTGVDERGREREFQHIVSPPGITMDRIFADMTLGRNLSYMSWLERDKLERILGPAERDIRGGAQQRRPVGRVALFLRWSTPIYQALLSAISRMYGDQETEEVHNAEEIERSKRMIFIIGSVAGGTGSGFLIDIANLVRHAVQSNANWQSVDISAVIVLPDAFLSYTTAMEDPTNLKPNSFAALRELDRFVRTHSADLPYMLRYGEDIRSITWSINQPVDHVYLVDTTSRDTGDDLDLSGSPLRGVFPCISDFVMAHIDRSLGDAVATLRSNAGQYYEAKSRAYSSFNIRTYILPIDDIVESFSYRFLREMLARQFLPVNDRKLRAQLEQQAGAEVERIFGQSAFNGLVIPAIIQKAIAITRPVGAEPPETTWQGLFNHIQLSDSAFAKDYETFDRRMTELGELMTPTGEGEFRRERYDDGYSRLIQAGNSVMDRLLGPQLHPDDEASRSGGEWDRTLARYRDALRTRFAEVLDSALLDILNRRDAHSRVLEPARIVFAQALIAHLKRVLVGFRSRIEEQYQHQGIENRIRQTGDEVRRAITTMRETKDAQPLMPFGKPAPRKAQETYIGFFIERMELLLHQRISRVVVDILDALGAAERDADGEISVLEQAAVELDIWQATFREVDDIVSGWMRAHDQNRREKRQIKVRRYLTNETFEEQLYLSGEFSGAVGLQVLGQVRGVTGLVWQRRVAADAFAYTLETRWPSHSSGPAALAVQFFEGVKELFGIVRDKVSVADRVASEFGSPAAFINTVSQVSEPLLRYNPLLNDGKPMSREQYISFNTVKASDQARHALDAAAQTLSNQGFQVDTSAESSVACTVIEISRGVQIGAVDQFMACEPDYRAKIFRGRESLHLLPEEQNAAEFEGQIERLGEHDNRQRLLAPELTIAMGDLVKLKAFTLACAYDLVKTGSHQDEDGQESRELFLQFTVEKTLFRYLLTDSRLVRRLDPRFNDVQANEQIARLYLNALQNFVLKLTEKRGVTPQMVPLLVQALQQRGVGMGNIGAPFTLELKHVNQGIKAAGDLLGSPAPHLSAADRESQNAALRIAKLRDWIADWIATFKRSPMQSVKDMGTVMHLLIDREIRELEKDLRPTP